MGELIRKYLVDQGHTVTYVTTGRSALSMLEEYAFDAVVSDYELEYDGPSGLDIIRYAQEQTPLITTVSFSSIDRTHEFRSAGVPVDHMLIKSQLAKLGRALEE